MPADGDTRGGTNCHSYRGIVCVKERDRKRRTQVVSQRERKIVNYM